MSHAMDLPIVAAGQAANDQHQAEREKLGLKEDAHAGYGHFEAGAKVTDTDASSDVDFRAPTEEEQRSLRRIPAAIPWTAFLIAICELAERFSYYGTIQVFQNFIQHPLPDGSTTGSDPNGQPGALGKGQTAATGLTTFNTFWVYTMPLVGGYLADAHWGRFKTINIAVGIAIVGHILLIISAIPAVIQMPDGALACFSIAIIIMGLGTGMFKSTVSPLIAEQVKGERQSVITLKSGENIIVDPALTAGRLFNFFYLAINIGAVVGQISMIYAEKYVGFWLSYALPTVVFMICVPVLYFGRNKYVKTPPSGSVLAEALRVMRICLKGNMSWNPVRTVKNMRKDTFWDAAMPSKYSDETRPKWMSFDDAWVHEVARGYKACYVFLLFPFYWLCYNQISNNLISQAANLKKNNVPTELTSNLDPIALVILIPIFESFIYPGLRRLRINFTPLKRIAAGFWVAAFSMVWAAVTQHYIYKRSPCGDNPSADACVDGPLAMGGETDISVWTQTGAFVLVAISEIFTSVTGLEYAFTKAPKSMRSLVMSVFLFTNAISAAIQQAFLPLTKDPLQVIQYSVFAGLSAFAGLLFFFTTRSLDRDEDKLNNLVTGDFVSPNKALGAPVRDVLPKSDASSDEKH